MQNSHSSNLLVKPGTILCKAAQKHLNYFNPKGASNRVWPQGVCRPYLEVASICSKSYLKGLSPGLSPSKSEKKLQSHSELAKSTKVLESLSILSTETSPHKLPRVRSNLSPQPSLPRLSKLLEIADSCDKLSKLNKSDIITANNISKESHSLSKNTNAFLKNQQDLKPRHIWNDYFSRKRPNKVSLDKIKKESFETACFVEQRLRKNTVKKLKEQIMPWKKILIEKPNE